MAATKTENRNASFLFMAKNNQGMLCKVFSIWLSGFAKLPLSPYRCQQKIGYYVTIYEKRSSIRVIITSSSSS